MSVPIQSNHMQIYKHEYTRIIKITQTCYVIITSNIKISSHGLIITDEQFNLNHSAKHIFSHNIQFSENTIHVNSKTLGFTVHGNFIFFSLVHLVNPGFTAISGLNQINTRINTQLIIFILKNQLWSSHGLLHFASKFSINSIPMFGTDQTPPNGLYQLEHLKSTKNGNKNPSREKILPRGV